MHALVRDLVEAALDQRQPSAELRAALNAYLEATQHRLSESYQRRFIDEQRLGFSAQLDPNYALPPKTIYG